MTRNSSGCGCICGIIGLIVVGFVLEYFQINPIKPKIETVGVLVSYETDDVYSNLITGYYVFLVDWTEVRTKLGDMVRIEIVPSPSTMDKVTSSDIKLYPGVPGYTAHIAGFKGIRAHTFAIPYESSYLPDRAIIRFTKAGD